MKKLAIFGDSYSIDNQKNHKSWIDYLRDVYNVINFSEAGCSLWFCYNNFLKNYKNFEKIIFLVPRLGRITLPNTTTFNVSKHIIFLKIDNLLKNEKNNEIKKELETLKSYYVNIHDDEKEISHHLLMIKNIKTLKSDTIIYPCAKESNVDSNDLPLWEITKFEDRTANFLLPNPIYTALNMIDTRCCHITEPNHKVVADMFLKKLNNENFFITLDNLIPSSSKKLYKKII